MANGEEEEEEEEGDEDEYMLDLTSAQLHDLADVDLPPFLKELDLTANRLSLLDDRISHMSQLQKLSIQQNLFGDDAVNVLAQWPALFGMQELVLRDNKLSKIPPLKDFVNLKVLDISFNEVVSLEGMSIVTSRLQELYVQKNEVAKIEELEHLQNLRVLELGSNKIRVMEGLERLTALRELWLGRNRIRNVDLCGLTGLVRISIQSNRLTSMRAFEECVNLEELYLSHNSISQMEGLSPLHKLRVLDLASNKITEICDIENLTRLEDLWLNDNSIATLDGIEKLLEGCMGCLTTIYLERNPCELDPNYMRRLRAALPKLQQLDSHLVLH
ncbi:unnamed protein product [Sphagnum jensenii]|uniref:Protein phosphatase 1 regulatory subunit 7 n=1 Tax=Sphagnum jensenii TaxID=128206 RepID=A0ABP1BFE0_9BRYO